MDKAEALNAFDPSIWRRRATHYSELSWVSAADPMKEVFLRLKLQGSEFVVDVGTGSQAILRAIEPFLGQGGRVIGFDLSPEMLGVGVAGGQWRPNVFVADAKHIPLDDEIADIVIARQVIHHIEDPREAIREMVRIVRPGGKIVVAEHVVMSSDLMGFERGLFDLKEPGRHLWLPDQLLKLLTENTVGFSKVDFIAGYIPGYSMIKDWAKNGGLSEEDQKRIFSYLNDASDEIKQALNLEIAPDDVTMDGHYLCVISQK